MKPDQWYGQSLISLSATESSSDRTDRDYFGKPLRFTPGGWGTIEVEVHPLSKLLPEGIVDLIDMDVQGAEADLVECSMETLSTSVRRLHIGTHSHEIEERLRRTLAAAGWLTKWDFVCQTRQETPFGSVEFGDGVQGWLNPHLT
jgi:hypothetical protein